VQAVDHLGERAVEGRHGHVVERIRRPEHVVAGLEIVIVRVGAGEVRGRVAPRAPGADAPRDAVMRVAGAAEVAAPARVEVRVDDAVPHAERRPRGVRRHPGAELRGTARHLVPHDRRAAPRGATVPPVQIRAADVGDGHANQDAVRLDLGQRELTGLEGLLDAGEEEGSTIHTVLPGRSRR